jgi:hypothetical protein
MCNHHRAVMLATGVAPGLRRETALPLARANSCVLGTTRAGGLASCRRLLRLDTSEEAGAKEAPRLPAPDVGKLRKREARPAAGFPADRRLESRAAADWLVGAAFLPMIILAAAIAIAAVAAPSDHPANSELAASTAAAMAGNADGYVEALARIGVATIPCQSGVCREDVRVTDR